MVTSACRREKKNNMDVKKTLIILGAQTHLIAVLVRFQCLVQECQTEVNYKREREREREREH